MNGTPTDFSLTGMGVVVDDYANDDDTTKDDIVDLLEQIKEAGIPHIRYVQIPPAATVRHFTNAAFILLDWELWKNPEAEFKMEGVTTGGELQAEGKRANIDFLKSLKDVCFAPVFVFSHLPPDGIRKELQDAGLIGTDEKHAFIVVRRKADLKRPAGGDGHPLLDAVNAWINENPSVYVLSHWKDAVTRSQNTLFWDLFGKHPGWPSVLWTTYQGEGDDPEQGLADVLMRNMRARLFPLSLDADCVAPKGAPCPDQATTQTVLEACMIVPHDKLPANQYGCGDIFKGSAGHYWINIRCDCDCIAHVGQNLDEITLYLLAADQMRTKDFKETFHDTYGQLQPRQNMHVLFPVEGKGLRIDFGKLCQVKVGELANKKAKRIGRLTAPYITQIRQRFGMHLQREGLPRVPNAAVPSEENARPSTQQPTITSRQAEQPPTSISDAPAAQKPPHPPANLHPGKP